MPFTYSVPTATSFKDKGLSGYTFGPLKHKNVEIYYIESQKGHDTFIVSKRITRIYYILSGNGYFSINNKQYPVEAGVVVEVPRQVEYSYTGRMTLLCISVPRWFKGNDSFTRWNPDVIGFDAPCTVGNQTWCAALARVSIFGKSPVSACLKVNQWLWTKVPASILGLGPIHLYGRVLHKLVCARQRLEPFLPRFFVENRPKLELIRRLADTKKIGDTLRVAVVGCNVDGEAYSIAWQILSKRPDLRLFLHAVDVSKPAVERAKRGVYSLTASNWAGAPTFECMTPAEIDELFDREGAVARVKSWIREGVNWQLGSAADVKALELLGPQDLVIANNFLCYLGAADAERYLRDIARLLRPDGYLFVSGIDLDIRTKVARDLGWMPLQELLEEIHDRDLSLRRDWPWHYSGLEPLNKRKPDWVVRYATAFRLAQS